eukprot:366228-Chlamydomonas_euryale.AAC.29
MPASSVTRWQQRTSRTSCFSTTSQSKRYPLTTSGSDAASRRSQTFAYARALLRPCARIFCTVRSTANRPSLSAALRSRSAWTFTPGSSIPSRACGCTTPSSTNAARSAGGGEACAAVASCCLASNSRRSRLAAASRASRAAAAQRPSMPELPFALTRAAAASVAAACCRGRAALSAHSAARNACFAASASVNAATRTSCSCSMSREMSRRAASKCASASATCCTNANSWARAPSAAAWARAAAAS